MVVTHAMSPPVRMTIPQMQEAAHEGAYIEFVYSALLGPNGLKIEDYVAAIRALGARSCILASDLGNRETRCTRMAWRRSSQRSVKRDYRTPIST